MQVPVAVEIPARPALEACPEKPDLTGKVTDHNTVEVTFDTALRIREYISALQACQRANEVKLSGHIEKLENRLRALR